MKKCFQYKINYKPIKIKVLLGIVLSVAWWASWGALFSWQAPAQIKSCIGKQLANSIGFAQAVHSNIPPQASLRQLSNIHQQLSSATNKEVVQNIEARRLINQEDWPKAKAKLGQKAWSYYGEQTMTDWLKAREYVLNLPPDQAIDSTLLKDIHKKTSATLRFHGFEGRRIRAQFERGEISEEEKNRLLKRAFKENQEVAGTPHSTLRGKFRSDPVDEIEHRGSSFRTIKGPDGVNTRARYFTAEELSFLRKNPHVTVDESSIKPIPGKNDGYTGRATYANVEQVDNLVQSILQETESQLSRAKTPEQVVKAVVSMSRDLISVHPFLDGNGRSIRLLGDYILQRHNLPPSLYPNESDLTMSLEEAVNFQTKGMRDYLTEYQSHFTKSHQQRLP